MLEKPLEAEFEYFLNNRKALLEKYNGKVVVIKNQRVIGVFSTEKEAIAKTQEKEELGTFLIQRVEPDESSYTMTLYSSVAYL